MGTSSGHVFRAEFLARPGARETRTYMVGADLAAEDGVVGNHFEVW
jgi:hypothetical protein